MKDPREVELKMAAFKVKALTQDGGRVYVLGRGLHSSPSDLNLSRF
jgi:hypothetical protein